MKISKLAPIIMVYLLAGLLAGCGIQAIPKSKNNVEASLAEVTNQYKRRADLIPGLVEVVKGYAKHEAATLEAVVNARAKATQMQVDASNLNAKQIQDFANAQGELSTALGKLMMITENYPDLKANQNFRDLQAQLEGTENRITVARQRYIESIKEFNNYVSVFPYNLTNSLFFHLEKMPQWTVENAQALEKPPEVKF
jgi:LemA protein